jgi:hypothetical protein
MFRPHSRSYDTESHNMNVLAAGLNPVLMDKVQIAQ